jgi:TolA-binding protein
MQKIKLLKSVILLCFLFSFGISNAQQTLIYTDDNQQFKKGVELMNEEKYNIAKISFEEFIKSYSETEAGKSQLIIGDAYYYKAYCALKSNNPTAEAEYLSYLKSFKGHGKNNMAYFDLGSWYFNNKNYSKSLEYYDNIAPRDLPSSSRNEYTFKVAYSNFALKKFKPALNGFEEVKRTQNLYTEDATYYSGLINYYDKKYDNALEDFRKIENTNNYRRVVPYYVAQILFLQNKFDEVIKYAEPKVNSTLVLNNRPEINQLLGQSYFEKNDYKSAATYLQSYIQQAKTVNKEDYYQLGYALYQNKDYAGAVKSFEKLTSVKSSLSQNALFLLGESYLKIGEKSKARDAFKQASSMDFDAKIKEDAIFNHAKLSYELNIQNDAITGLQNFINNYPQSKNIKEANDLLAKVFLETRNYNEAIAIIEKMINPSLEVREAYQKITYYQGVEHYNNGKLTEAETSFRKSLKFNVNKGIEALCFYWIGDIEHSMRKFDNSIQNIDKFISFSSHLSKDFSGDITKSHGSYLQGYNHYKKSDYQKAANLFIQVINDPAVRVSKIYPDALLRGADSYFMLKQYVKAEANYNLVVDGNFQGSDYAFFQKAIIQGLNNQHKTKINSLNNMIKRYPNSLFADDAVFEIANTHLLISELESATTEYRNLIRNYPKSELVPEAHLKLGLILFNKDRYDEALAEYKKVVDQFPRTPASNEAMVAIKDVFIAKGDPNGYISYIKTVPNANITKSEEDSILYLSAENQFSRGNYATALKSFNEYILRFPNGYFVVSASFYRGECHFSTEDFNSAYKDYMFVLGKPKGRFTERSYQRASSINFYHFKNYALALEHYHLLKEHATTEENRVTATMGIIRSAFFDNKYTISLNNASSVIGNPAFAQIQIAEAHFYKAKSNFELKKYDDAMSDFKQVIDKINNEWAAESQFRIAEIQFIQKKFEDSESNCFLYINKYPSYRKWLVKTYLLLADIYIQRNNLLQAKATVQSLLDNYQQKDELRDEALKKYNQILALESGQSKIAPEKEYSPTIEFENE